jgi:hypothetical protein
LKNTFSRLSVCLVPVVAAGCSDTSAPSVAGKVTVAVAALELPGVTDACYDLEVKNDEDQVVWSETTICASAYGAGGDITYIGTCDATDGPDADLIATNTVTLRVKSLSSTSGPINDFINPCAAPLSPNGCQLSAPCVENADTPITFNLTIMREANQGFFDIGVNFRDIFCSAKYDCGTLESPIELLHDGAGLRSKTHVIGFACTASPGANIETKLWFSDVDVTCTGASPSTSTIAANLKTGNLCVAGSANGSTAPSSCAEGTALPAEGPLYQAAVYSGVENLGGMNKVYLNLAFGIETPFPASTTCSLSFSATADDANDPVLVDGAVPDGNIYPFIKFDIPNLATCVGNHAVNTTTEVTTEYTSPPASNLSLPYWFNGVLAGGQPPPKPQITKMCEPGAGYLSAMGPGCGLNSTSRATAWLDLDGAQKVAPGNSLGDLSIGWTSSGSTEPQNGAMQANTGLSITEFNSVNCSATDGRSYAPWAVDFFSSPNVVCLRTASGNYFKFARHIPLYGVSAIAWARGEATGAGGLSSLTLLDYGFYTTSVAEAQGCLSGEPCQSFIPAGSFYEIIATAPHGFTLGNWGHSSRTGTGACQGVGGPCVFSPSGKDLLSVYSDPTPSSGELFASSATSPGLTQVLSYTNGDSSSSWICGRLCMGVVPVGATVGVAIVGGQQNRTLIWDVKCQGVGSGESCTYSAWPGLPLYSTTTFTPSVYYSNSVSVTGAGGYVSYGADGSFGSCSATSPCNDFQAPADGVVRLEAVPFTGAFPGWASGPCVGQGARCVFEVSGNSSTTITFP